MKIGIDISQLAYANTGVANYLHRLIENILEADGQNEYVLFFSSLRRGMKRSDFRVRNADAKFRIRRCFFPPKLLDLIWNRLHVLPLEWLAGDVDVFITSDWTEPPARRAKKTTILYDLIVCKYPEETDKLIVETQLRKLEWVKKESDMVICISESTKKDAEEILGIDKKKLKVVLPGI